MMTKNTTRNSTTKLIIRKSQNMVGQSNLFVSMVLLSLKEIQKGVSLENPGRLTSIDP